MEGFIILQKMIAQLASMGLILDDEQVLRIHSAAWFNESLIL